MDNTTDGNVADQTSIFDMHLQYIGTICVKSEDDTSNCGIEDCLYLSDHKMVVSDSYNKCVKLVDMITSTIISRCELPSEPFAVTYVSPTVIATTHPTKNRILFININNDQLSISHDIKVNGACGGMYCKDGKLALTYRAPTKIEILDLEGKLLHTICGPDKNKDMFELPSAILFSKDEDALIVSDFQRNKVMKVDFHGRILSSYEHHGFEKPSGLTLTQDGTILACSEDTHGLHAISRDFDKSKEILANDKNLQFPGIITYSYSDNKLYINNNIECKTGNNMLIYQFL